MVMGILRWTLSPRSCQRRSQSRAVSSSAVEDGNRQAPAASTANRLVCRPIAVRLYCAHSTLQDGLAAPRRPVSTGGFHVALDIAATRAAAGFWRLGGSRPDQKKPADG